MVIIKKHHFILIIISWMLVVLVQAKTHLFHISELYEEDGRIVLSFIFPRDNDSLLSWKTNVRYGSKRFFSVPNILWCIITAYYSHYQMDGSRFRTQTTLLHMHQLTTKCIRPPSHIATAYFLVLMRFGGLRVHTSIIFVYTHMISSARQMCLNVLQDIFIQEAGVL